MSWLDDVRADAARRMAAIRAGVAARVQRGSEAVARVARETRDAVVQTYEAGRAMASDVHDSIVAAYDSTVQYTSALVEASVLATREAYATASAAVRRTIDRLRAELQAMVDAAKAVLQRMIAEAAALPGRVGQAIGRRLADLKTEVNLIEAATQTAAVGAAGQLLDWHARRNTPRRTDEHFTADRPDPDGEIIPSGASHWPTSSPRPGQVAAPRTVYYHRHQEAGSRAPSSRATVADGRHVLSPPEDAFIYMDVGRWGGSKSPGADPARGRFFARARDFGIICGHTAVLCQYGEGRDSSVSIGTSVPVNASNRAEAHAINAFLAHVGDVKVVSQMRHQLAGAGPFDASTIHVFLGDMHLPVTTRRAPDASDTDTNGQMGRFEVADAMFRFAMEMDLRTAAIIGAAGGGAAGALGTAPDSVLRAAGGAGVGALAEDHTGGNVALGAATGALATTGLAGVARAIPGTVGGAAAGGAAAVTAWAAMQLYRTIAQRAYGYVPSHTPGLSFDAAGWLYDYAGADIFESAHEDLERFCNKIATWNAGQGPKVQVTQCGDMFDLWVGMLCFFADSPNNPPALDTLWGAPSSLEFVNYWVNSTVSSDRGAGIGAFMNIREKVMLYGNHDNLLAPSAMTPARIANLHQPSRQPNLMQGRQFFAEHGHRTDTFNGDGIRKGWAMTQLAFKAPIVREIEPDGRLAFLKGAATHWEANGRYIFYVMGHTHVPYLTKLILRNL